MTTALFPAQARPTSEVAGSSEDHLLPCMIAVVICLASSLVPVWLTGVPH